MSIGETLAEARREAGLTVTQVSQRTRIRETIIRGIEQDDYAPCGGDFYARGHVRSIARVVGTDPVPLIAEYDANLRAADDTDQFDALELAAQLKRSAPPKSPKPGKSAKPAASAPEAPPGPAGPAGLAGLGPAVAPGTAATPEPADEASPTGTIGLRAWPGSAGRRRTNWTAVLAVALLVAVGVLGYHLASSPQRQTASPAAETGPTHHPAVHHARRPKPTVTHTSTPAAPPVTTLTPVSVTAFGPGGAAQGDNPQLVSVSAGNLTSPWKTDWYDTADFGNLQSGTGLLVDLGRPVTITSAQITLGGAPGASLQLRTGDVATLADLRPAATATDAGGAVQLRLSGSTPSRYLLIWFTKLPPDSSGTFQAVVSAIKLQGESSAT
jgi:Helix-turn-helix domain